MIAVDTITKMCSSLIGIEVGVILKAWVTKQHSAMPMTNCANAASIQIYMARLAGINIESQISVAITLLPLNPPLTQTLLACKTVKEKNPIPQAVFVIRMQQFQTTMSFHNRKSLPDHIPVEF